MKLAIVIALTLLLPGLGKSVREEIEPALRCQAAVSVALSTSADADLDRAEQECDR